MALDTVVWEGVVLCFVSYALGLIFKGSHLGADSNDEKGIRVFKEHRRAGKK